MTRCYAHPPDLLGESRFRCHVPDGEGAVGRVVEQTLVESVREEANMRTAVDQSQSQQAADVEVQVVT